MLSIANLHLFFHVTLGPWVSLPRVLSSPMLILSSLTLWHNCSCLTPGDALVTMTTYSINSRNSYQTEIMKVNYGSRQIGLDSGNGGQSRIIFDTGSSYSYFPEEAYNSLVSLVSFFYLCYGYIRI